MIYTSYFWNLKKLQGIAPNMVFVSIAGKTPTWFEEDKIGFKYQKLMPRYGWRSQWHEMFKENYESEESIKWYTRAYRETVLSKLNPHEVKCELYDIASRRNVCLLCYETPEKFCHRHLVSKWLRDANIMAGEYVRKEDIKQVFCNVEEL